MIPPGTPAPEGSVPPADKSPTVRSVLLHLLFWAGALPGAAGLLGGLISELHFGELLQRIVVGYLKVSEAVWAPVLALAKLNVRHEYLSAYALTLLPAVAYLLFWRNRMSSSRETRIWLTLNTIAATLIGVAFWQPGLVIGAALGVLFRPAIVRSRLSSLATDVLLATVLVAAPAAVAFVFGSSVVPGYRLGDWVGFWNAYTLSTLVLLGGVFISFASYAGYRGTAYSVAVALGIVAVDWLGKTAGPGVTAWLTSIGA